MTEMYEAKMPPIHPGEILLEDFMKPMGIGQYRLAKAMSVYPRKVNEIIQSKRSFRVMPSQPKVGLGRA
jgi:addiction module HigA family antidote